MGPRALLEQHLFLLPGIKPSFLGRPDRSLVTVRKERMRYDSRRKKGGWEVGGGGGRKGS